MLIQADTSTFNIDLVLKSAHSCDQLRRTLHRVASATPSLMSPIILILAHRMCFGRFSGLVFKYMYVQTLFPPFSLSVHVFISLKYLLIRMMSRIPFALLCKPFELVCSFCTLVSSARSYDLSVANTFRSKGRRTSCSKFSCILYPGTWGFRSVYRYTCVDSYPSATFVYFFNIIRFQYYQYPCSTL